MHSGCFSYKCAFILLISQLLEFWPLGFAAPVISMANLLGFFLDVF